MRCARCDRIAVPQAVGRTAGGRVVFGWCLDCLEEEGCTDVVIARPGQLRRVRPHLVAPRPDEASRRLALGMLTAVLALWALAFLLLGLIRFASPTALAGSPFGGRTAPALILIGLALKGTSLAIGVRLVGADGLRRWGRSALRRRSPALMRRGPSRGGISPG